jgi:hypothetical protein
MLAGEDRRKATTLMTTDVNDLLSQIPFGQLAQQLGVDEQTAQQAAQQALPALLSGMQANAADPEGAASLTEALGQHDDNLLDGGVDFNQVDTVDGDKIVSNVFGDNRDQVINQLGGMGSGGGFGNRRCRCGWRAGRSARRHAGRPERTGWRPRRSIGRVAGWRPPLSTHS